MTNPLLTGRKSDAFARTRIRIVITAFIVRNDRARVKYGTEEARRNRPLGGRTQPDAITLVPSINCTTPATRWQQLMQSCL